MSEIKSYRCPTTIVDSSRTVCHIYGALSIGYFGEKMLPSAYVFF